MTNMGPLPRKTVLRFSLIALSVVLGVVVHFGNWDSYEVKYVVALQQAALTGQHHVVLPAIFAHWGFHRLDMCGSSVFRLLLQ